MRVVAYNIQWGKGRDGRIDLDRVARAVRDADIICLQEVERHWRAQEHPDQAARLAALLPGRDWAYGASVSLKGAGPGARREIGNMTLSRAPITSMRVLPLPARAVPGAMNDEQSMLETVIGDEGFRVYNTHLNYISAEQRLEQLVTLLRFIGEAPARGGPISLGGKPAPGPEDDWIVLMDGKVPPMPEEAMLLGDFNSAPGSAETALVRRSFGDALKLAGMGDDEGVTFPAGSEPAQRLDYIFLTPGLAGQLKRAWIDDAAVGSDHQPVWAEIAAPGPSA